jgi:UDP-N-acetylglucosamine--N-acetylmuramyl-(pentapeptide) pyrophosphoryl-undecaprenol N-acetylglucosamine transferase
MTIVIAAGGTGGHLYPAIAVAREFIRRDPSTRILFVGTTRGIERKVLAHEGFPLQCITANPLMGKSPVEMMKALASLPVSLWQSLGVLKQQGADLVFGVGGYTSPAMLVAAFLRRIPGVILEPNAYPGMANKAVAPLVQRIFLAFESTVQWFDRRKTSVVGNPVRRAFLESSAVPSGPAKDGRARHLLIFGGSQGAKAINSAVIEALPLLGELREGLTITHQTGEADHARVLAAYEQVGMSAHVVPFLYDMPAVLREADLVVARAGAMTIAELTVCGKGGHPDSSSDGDLQSSTAECRSDGSSRRCRIAAASGVDRRGVGQSRHRHLQRARAPADHEPTQLGDAAQRCGGNDCA